MLDFDIYSMMLFLRLDLVKPIILLSSHLNTVKHEAHSWFGIFWKRFLFLLISADIFPPAPSPGMNSFTISPSLSFFFNIKWAVLKNFERWTKSELKAFLQSDMQINKDLIIGYWWCAHLLNFLYGCFKVKVEC